jgi:DNA-binding PadR family transcriptional regulator
MSGRRKIKNLPLVLLFICLDNFRHPSEIMNMLGGSLKSSYDRNINKYLARLEKDGLMISKWENGKKYYKTNEEKIAELIIKDKKASLQKAMEDFKEEKKKIEESNMPKEMKRQMIESLKPKIKIPSKKDAIQEFKDMFEVAEGRIYLKTGKEVPYSLLWLADISE